MDRDRAVWALVVLLAVVIVGTAAAGLVDQRASGEASEGLGGGNGSGVGSGNGSGLGFNASSPVESVGLPPWTIRLFVGGVLTVSALFGALYVAGLLFARDFRDLLKQLANALARAIGLVLLFAAILLIAWLISQVLGVGGGGMGGGGSSGASGSGGGQSGPTIDPSGLPAIVMVAGAVVLVALVVILARRGDDESDVPAQPDLDVDPTMPPERGRQFLFHGEAGDAGATNEVYRTWRALAREVGATPQSTPADVRRRAIEAGYERERVAELTDLFRSVRYGTEPADSGREARARELGDALDPEG